MSLPKAKKCDRQSCGGEMMLVDDVYVLTTAKKNTDGSVVFNPASGMPVKAYICKKCAAVELYSAILTGEF